MQKRIVILVIGLLVLVAGLFVVWKQGLIPTSTAIGEPPRSDTVTGLETMVRDAIDQSVAAVDASPGDPTVRADLGRIYHAHDLYDAAIVAYRQSLELDPTQTRVRYLLADAQTRRGNLEDAAATYEQLETDGWTYAPGIAAYGRLLLDLGRPGDASRAFRRAMQLDSTNAASYVGLARVALSENRNEDAAETLESLLSSGIRVPYVHHLLGMALQRLGRVDEAAVHASMSDGTRPSWPDEWFAGMRDFRTGYRAILEGAQSKMGSGAPMEAVKDLESLRTSFPQDVTLLNYLSKAYAGAGLELQALQALNDARTIDPGSVATLVNLSLHHERAGNLGEAMTWAQAAVSANPESGAAQLQLGRVQVLARDNAAAAATLQNAVRLGAGGEQDRVMYVSVLMALGRWDDAERAARQLVQRYPASGTGLVRLVQILIQRGNLAEARAALTRLRSVTDDQGTVQQLENAVRQAERQRGG